MRKPGSSPWRLFLIWCLALVLPVQGLAAGVGLHCVTLALPAIAVAAAATDAGQPPCHEARHTATDPSAAQAATSPGDSAVNAETACSACADCHVASAPPSQHLDVVAAIAGDTLVSALSSLAASVTETGLERPPKYLAC